MKAWAILPARGGSKGVPLKNLHPLWGQPLIAHSIRAAQACPEISRLIVSTDSPAIAEVATALGAEVPFLRPAELSLDDTTDEPVFTHALRWFQTRGEVLPDFVVHLRATSPRRDPRLLSKAIHLLREAAHLDCIRGVCVPNQNPYKMWRINEAGLLTPLLSDAGPESYNRPRQQLPPVYWQVGSIDVIRTRTILEKKSMTGENILPIFVSPADALDLDNPEDFHVAEKLGP